MGGANPLRATAHAGTKYCFHNRVGQSRVWEHKDLLGTKDVEALFGELTPAELERRDLFVRAVFRNVPLSCMSGHKAQPPKKTPAKVVSIASGRKYQTDLSSERRAA